VHLRQHQHNTGGARKLINLTDQVRRVIEITGLAEYLGINDPVP
jgi:anti-anti-sigma regulatory factor